MGTLPVYGNPQNTSKTAYPKSPNWQLTFPGKRVRDKIGRMPFPQDRVNLLTLFSLQ
jgi:hypothetical protein